MSWVKTVLEERAEAMIEGLLDEAINRRKMGRTVLVNRIRGGKVQMRVQKSAVKGFRLKDGKLVRMSPAEIRKRKRGAKISARKRKTEMAQILRNRRISLMKRKSRLGG